MKKISDLLIYRDLCVIQYTTVIVTSRPTALNKECCNYCCNTNDLLFFFFSIKPNNFQVFKRNKGSTHKIGIK